MRPTTRSPLPWLAALALIIVGEVMVARPAAQFVTNRIVYLADGAGNALSSSLEGSIRGLAVLLVDPNTNAYLTYTNDPTHDATAGTQGPQLMGYASAAAPTDVGADGRAAHLWSLRNGALTINPTYSGVLGSVNNGAAGTGVPRVTIANDSTGVVGLNAGTNLIGFAAPAGSATTTNSLTRCYITSAASTNATNCKASAGNLYGYEFVNTTSTLYYLRLYNLSSSPTCSSSTGFIATIPVPHGTAAGGGIANSYTVPESYGTGIGFCLTGGGSSTDNTNAATGVYISLFYK